MSGTAIAFYDLNGNGVQDEGEQALPNFLFHILPTNGSHSHSITNIKGEARLVSQYGPCDGAKIIAEPPPGWQLTTPATYPLSADNTTSAFGFGFVVAEGSLPPTPYPALPLHCTRFMEGRQVGFFTRIRTDSRGHVWIVALGGLFEFIPASEILVEHPSSGLTLAIGSDGTIIAGLRDIEVFHGSDWRTIEFHGSEVLGAAAAVGGDFWILGTESLLHYDPGGTLLESLPLGPLLYESSLEITADQVLWITGLEGELRALQLEDREHGVWEFQVFEVPGDLDYLLQNATAAPDGSLWFTTGGWLFQVGGQTVRFDPKTETWQIFSAATTGGRFIANTVLGVAVAEDGSVWVAAGIDGLINLAPAITENPQDAQILVYLPEELQGENLTAVGVESPGVIWTGSDDILFRCKTGN